MEEKENLKNVIRFIDIIVAILLIAYGIKDFMYYIRYGSYFTTIFWYQLYFFTAFLIFLSMYPYKSKFATSITVIASSIFLFISSTIIGLTLAGIYNNELLFVAIPSIALVYCMLRGYLIVEK